MEMIKISYRQGPKTFFNETSQIADSLHLNFIGLLLSRWRFSSHYELCASCAESSVCAGVKRKDGSSHFSIFVAIVVNEQVVHAQKRTHR